MGAAAACGATSRRRRCRQAGGGGAPSTDPVQVPAIGMLQPGTRLRGPAAAGLARANMEPANCAGLRATQ